MQQRCVLCMGVSGRDAAVSAISANFEARNDDVKAAVALDLPFEAVEKVTLKLGNLAAAKTSHVDVVSLRATFVKMLFPLQVHEVELVDKALPFEQIQGAIDSDAIDLRIEFLGAAQYASGVEVLLGSFYDAQDHLALAGHAKAAGDEFGLETSGLFGLRKRHDSFFNLLQLGCNYWELVYLRDRPSVIQKDFNRLTTGHNVRNGWQKTRRRSMPGTESGGLATTRTTTNFRLVAFHLFFDVVGKFFDFFGFFKDVQ